MSRLRTLEGLFDELLLATAGVCAQPRSPAARRLLRETRDRAQAWRRADLAVGRSEAALAPAPPERVTAPEPVLRPSTGSGRGQKEEHDEGRPMGRLPYRDD